jgi:hypothetical protein
MTVVPRLIQYRDAPGYLGMDRNRFNAEVRSFITEIPIGIQRIKNKDDRLIVLNRVALSVVEAQRGKHPSHVFTYKGKPTTRTCGTRLGCAPGMPPGCRRCVSTTSSTPSDVVCEQPA